MVRRRIKSQSIKLGKEKKKKKMNPNYCVECGQPIENTDGWLCERCKP